MTSNHGAKLRICKRCRFPFWVPTGTVGRPPTHCPACRAEANGR